MAVDVRLRSAQVFPAGAEALLAIEPQVLRDLIAARQREDWPTVAGIIDWLEAGL